MKLGGKRLKGKDDFFDRKRNFALTVYHIKTEKGQRIFFDPFILTRQAYRADDAATVVREYLDKQNKKRKPDEPELILLSYGLAPEEKK